MNMFFQSSLAYAKSQFIPKAGTCNISLSKFFTIFLFAFNYAFPAVSQSEQYPNKEFVDPRTFTPQTPDASGLFKMSDFGVDQASGTVTSSIPLATVNSGRIKLPISASYSANGIRVQEIASSIGLGWNLNYGYSISVTEEEPKTLSSSGRMYKYKYAALNATDLGTDWVREMKRAADGYYSTFSPVYRYHCGDYSGTFYYDTHLFETLKSFGNPYVNKIERLTTGSVLNGFKITTQDGLEYTFDKKETSLRISQQNAIGPATTSFLCTKIRDPLTEDQVTFQYSQIPTYTTYDEGSTIRYASPFNIPQGAPPDVWFPQSDIYQISVHDVSSWAVSRIDYKDGYIVFDVANDRLDINPTRIKGLTVYSRANGNVAVRQIAFNQSYFQTSGGSAAKYNYRLRLDDVTVTGIDALGVYPKEIYKFSYNPILLPPYRVSQNAREQNAHSVDYWGFYNGGANAGLSFISQDLLNELNASTFPPPTSFANYGIDRKANPAYSQACMLSAVKYPTGGVSRFTYEQHSFPGYYLGSNLGGVRIKNISSFENETATVPLIQKTYSYTASRVMTPVNRYTYSYTQIKGVVESTFYGYNIVSYQAGVISSDPLYDIAYHNGSPIFYDQVEEFNGTTASNNGKTVFTFNYNPPYYADVPFKDMGTRKLFSESIGRGQLKKKEVYKSTGPGSYEKVSQVANTYTEGGAFKDLNYLVGFGVRKRDTLYSDMIVWNWVGSQADAFYTSLAYTHQIPQDAFVYEDFYLNANEPRLIKSEVSKFVGLDEMKTTTNYFYDSQFHKQLSAVTFADSKGVITKKEYRYVADQSTISDVDAAESGYSFNSLINFNKLDNIIEQKDYINDVLVTKSRDHFTLKFNPNNGLNVPVTTSSEKTYYSGGSSASEKMYFQAYNNSLMVLGIYRESAPVNAYLYDDFDKNVIAEVTNSDYNDIRYTSFEPGATGKWTSNGTRAFDNNAISGDCIYNLSSSNTLQASQLNAGKTYLVSYWSRNGAYTVSGTISTTTGVTAGLWTYYEHKISGQQNISISGTGSIDEVRLCPLDSQMSTYTYDPMKGVTTTVDAKNYLLHYKYDGLGRLTTVFDQDHNIVKAYSYNYRP
jgi:YD repeat-containing protein